jgi:16S rRNA (cytidine1402-2'-O)-methyltransferase
MSGTLYVVATPIGNLGDITFRAAEILKRVPHIAAEDTRRARILLDHLGIGTRPHSLPAFDERSRAQGLITLIVGGGDLALITDAGTPAISDPGSALVALAVEHHIPVVPLPGPCAAIAAVSASGLPADQFCFLGFLPRKGQGRERWLQRLTELPLAVVLYESPNRVHETLLDLAQAWGDRRAVMARELTKLHEELRRGTLRSLAESLANASEPLRGEVVLVVEGAPERPESEDSADPATLDAELSRLLADGSRSIKELARELADQLGLPRKQVYARALELSGKKTPIT